MKLADLQAKKSKLTREMRSLADNPADNGDLSAEQEERFQTLKSELEGVEKKIERQQYLDELERKEAAAADDNPDYRKEVREYSMLRAIAHKAGMDVDAGREQEISQELAKRQGKPPGGIYAPLDVFHMEKRAITSGGTGSNIIPDDYRPGEFIDILRAKLVTRRLGARILSGLTGNVDIGRLTGSASAGWVSENSALSSSDATLDKLSLTPKHCGYLTEFSRNMLMQSSPDIEQLVRLDTSGLLARAIDSVAIEGGGSDEPTGIIETTGVPTVDVSGGWTWGKVLDFIATVETNDAAGTGFLTTPAVVKTLRSTVKETAVYTSDSPSTEYAVSADYLMNSSNSLAGYPCMSSTLVPANQVVFGNWKDLLIGYWSALDILVNPFESTAYSKGNVMVRGMMTADVGVRHTDSFCIADLTG